ncbi:MAG: proline--tRNA ligase [Erysipelotrichaceae bacterium]|jgi:prolyl-tRNA synthetase|nr:proline--tRNA ligase [Erysipelotrichaceae bacterium]
MRLSNSYFFTLRENVKDEDTVSSNLLVRAGYIKKSSAGVYMMLPLGFKALSRITAIVRDEMEKADCQELLMPALIPEEVYIKSGRRKKFGSSMFTLKDRFNKPFSLGPTHEELFAQAAQMHIHSYKDMPFSLFQFETKFRDEPRPRFGLIRVREFIMKDAYTFDVDEAGLDVAYHKQFKAYQNAFDRMGIQYVIVQADTGVMGGSLSEEFQALSPIGEDILVMCDHCDFASNIEIAACHTKHDPAVASDKTPVLADTPNAKTIEEVAAFFDKKATDFVKTLIYQVDDRFVAALVRGDRDVNETKLRKYCDGAEIALAQPEDVVRITKAAVGFAGPIGLEIPVIADHEIANMSDFIVGANQDDKHYTNVNTKDFEAAYIDLRLIQEGDPCPKCSKPVRFQRGIEVGNTFKLGTAYAQSMGLHYLDQNNQLQDVVMGSYGLGIGRCLAALAEQYNDQDGLCLPKQIAPYPVCIVVANQKDELQVKTAEELYQALSKEHIDVILDDRNERPGVKFKDMDLIGIPLRITVGRAVADGQVEIKERTQSEHRLIHISDVLNEVQSFLE